MVQRRCSTIGISYLVQPDGETLYDNDWEADDYVPGPFGRDNSVVRVSQPG